MLQRPLGKSPISVSPVAMGCWPIAGMTSLHVNQADSIKTLQAAVESGVNFFDTAYGYGTKGESEQLIARTLGSQRDQIVIATKCGLAWDENVQRVLDGSPATLKSQIDTSLSRLDTDRVELLYLHAPDPNTPIEESAGAMKEIMQSGKARTIGVSNFSMQQLVAFNNVCPITAVQPPYNLLQRDIEDELRPWCIDNEVSLAVYWPLMKGLLAGKLPRDYTFPPEDGRAKYPMFQGTEWQRNQDFVDELKVIGTEIEKTVAQIAVRWVLQQPGITAALCGAKRAYQIEETAQAMRFELSEAQLQRIDLALRKRGKSNARGAV